MIHRMCSRNLNLAIDHTVVIHTELEISVYASAYCHLYVDIYHVVIQLSFQQRHAEQ